MLVVFTVDNLFLGEKITNLFDTETLSNRKKFSDRVIAGPICVKIFSTTGLLLELDTNRFFFTSQSCAFLRFFDMTHAWHITVVLLLTLPREANSYASQCKSLILLAGFLLLVSYNFGCRQYFSIERYCSGYEP